MKIKIGISSKDGAILEDFDKAKSCQFCTHFKGYGLHAFAGGCLLKNLEFEHMKYGETAKECDSFDCRPELLVK